MGKLRSAPILWRCKKYFTPADINYRVYIQPKLEYNSQVRPEAFKPCLQNLDRLSMGVMIQEYVSVWRGRMLRRDKRDLFIDQILNGYCSWHSTQPVAF